MKILFGCKIADLDAKKRIEKHADVVELSECTEEAIIANLDGVEALIVPYTPNVVITKKVIDAGKSLKLVGTTSVKKNDIYFIGYRGKTFVGDYLWASENVNIINAFK